MIKKKKKMATSPERHLLTGESIGRHLNFRVIGRLATM